MGWPEEAPFDGIMVTAGAPVVPETLKEQLAEGGRLVIPVGGEVVQELLVVIRRQDAFQIKTITGCRFVRLVGEYGWRNDE